MLVHPTLRLRSPICSSAITSSIDSTGMISMPGTAVFCVSICAFVLVKHVQWRSILRLLIP
jgi:hypothetical protein